MVGIMGVFLVVVISQHTFRNCRVRRGPVVFVVDVVVVVFAVSYVVTTHPGPVLVSNNNSLLFAVVVQPLTYSERKSTF